MSPYTITAPPESAIAPGCDRGPAGNCLVKIPVLSVIIAYTIPTCGALDSHRAEATATNPSPQGRVAAGAWRRRPGGVDISSTPTRSRFARPPSPAQVGCIRLGPLLKCPNSGRPEFGWGGITHRSLPISGHAKAKLATPRRRCLDKPAHYAQQLAARGDSPCIGARKKRLPKKGFNTRRCLTG